MSGIGDAIRNLPSSILSLVTAKERAEQVRKREEQLRQYEQKMDLEYAQWEQMARRAKQYGGKIPDMPWHLYTRAANSGTLDLAREANQNALSAQDGSHLATLADQQGKLTGQEQARYIQMTGQTPPTGTPPSANHQSAMQDIQAQLQQEEAERLRRLAQQAGISRGGY